MMIRQLFYMTVIIPGEVFSRTDETCFQLCTNAPLVFQIAVDNLCMLQSYLAMALSFLYAARLCPREGDSDTDELAIW